jgi:glycine/D-amino acid oxidase-like deaminating enzyme
VTNRPGIGRTSDVVVIGGGTMGLSAALCLAEGGRAVTLVDQGQVWSEASGVNAGSLAVQNKLTPLVPYTLWALDLWKGLSARLGTDVGFRQTGGYKVATSPVEAERLRRTSEEQRQAGVPLRWLSQGDIRDEVPWLSQEVIAATWSPVDSLASPTRFGPALVGAAKAAGVEIVERAEARSVHANGRVTVETTRGTTSAEDVLIAAGAWSGKLAAMLGVHLPVSLDVNMVSVTEPAPATIGRMVTHARGILTLKQVANGSCMIGGGWQGRGTLADRVKDVDIDQVCHNLRLANRVVPGLAQLHVLRSWAGYEGVSPDSLPYVGRLPNHHHVYVAACARGGFTLGPLLGALVGELILTGETSRPIDLFAPSRFGNA